ncbi:MAG: hypothetical protein PVSMB2_20590 [Ktedonobacteraceae bacterium]
MSEGLFRTEDDTKEELMSADDLAILQTFDAMETWQHTETPVRPLSQDHDAEFTQEDMLLLFASEMDEDIGQMKHALSQLEQGDKLDETRFITLRRVAHKIRGTAGAMECYAMASIARHIEEVEEQINTGILFPLVGLNVLVQAVLALEITLQDLLTHGHESDGPLHALEHELEQFTLALHLQGETSTTTGPLAATGRPVTEEEARSNTVHDTQEYLPLPPSISVEVQRFERLLRLSEQVTETRTPLENAQEQVDIALRELSTAQGRLQQFERALIDLARPLRSPQHIPHVPASSLVERMLKEAIPSQNSTIQRRVLKRHPLLLSLYEKTEWDELEIDRYSERDKTISALRDAIAQVTIANTHVQKAYAQLHEVTQDYVGRATDVHTHLHLLRLTPLSVLLPHLQHVVATYAPDALFEITGEATEVDQDILDTLVVPLSTLLRTCIFDAQYTGEELGHKSHRIWFHAHALGNEVTLEIGFSMAVQGGALEKAQHSIQQLRGTIESQRNAEGSVSFFLRFPRSQGTVRGLLVRVGDQHVVLPFSQVQHVSDEQHQKTDIVYHLHKLLNFPDRSDPHRRVTPLIVLPQGRSRLVAGILVDEVVSDVTVIVKPLARYLQRPGVAGTVLDGKGHVLLLLDIPTLLKHYTVAYRHALPGDSDAIKVQRTQRLALIADDSTLLRKSLASTLEQAHYAIVEACDGLEALDLLTQNPPDVFLLDMEMPNLSGYDLLSIMHIYPELSDVKIVMLSSRATEKYKQRALELGVHAYLTKPCPQDVLLKTIEGVLQQKSMAIQ